MLQRLYIHNFRCLVNFELVLKDMPSALLIGKNGAGKSTVAAALEVFQNIGRGNNRVKDLVKPKDFSYGKYEVPMRFEIEALLNQKHYQYVLALELPEGSKERQIFEEQLLVDGKLVYSRKEAQTTLSLHPHEGQFMVDGRLVALPIIQMSAGRELLDTFRTWLARMVILAPVPKLMNGESNGETLEPMEDGSNFGEWFSGLISRYPTAGYSVIDKYLREVIPDIQNIQNTPIGSDAKKLTVGFKVNATKLNIDFKDLSDGEKCLFLNAVVLGANNSYGPLFCFWDEPDNYLAISEVGHFIMLLRQSFQEGSQLLVTSHNSEAIQRFSDENTFVLGRKNHLEPTRVKLLNDISVTGDLMNALICGEVEL